MTTVKLAHERSCPFPGAPRNDVIRSGLHGGQSDLSPPNGPVHGEALDIVSLGIDLAKWLHQEKAEWAPAA